MSERLSIPLLNRQQAREALKAQVFPYLAAKLQGEHRLLLTVAPEKRSDIQNRR